MTSPDPEFVRVYRLPSELTNGYCFGREVSIAFANVDWFRAPSEIGPNEITTFIKGKRYYDPKARFLVLGERPDRVFTIEPMR